MGKNTDFRRWIDPHLPVLLTVARSITRHPSDADDLVQETVLRAWRMHHTCQGEPRPWLFAIMRNTWTSMNRRQRIVPVEATQMYASSTPGADEMALRSHYHADVERALTTVSDAGRLAIELVDIEGLSYSEASEVIGISVGTLSSRLSRAREQLRAQLAHRARVTGSKESSVAVREG